MGILTKAKELSTPFLGLPTRVIGAASRQLAEVKAGGLPTSLGQLPSRVAGVVSRRSTSRDESAPIFAGSEQPWRKGLSEQEPEETLPGIGRAAVEATDESQVPEEVAKALEGLALPLEGEVAAADGPSQSPLQAPTPVVVADGSPQPPPQDPAPAATKKEAPSMMATDLRDLFAADEEVNEEFARLLKLLDDVNINDLVLQTHEVTALIGRRKQL